MKRAHQAPDREDQRHFTDNDPIPKRARVAGHTNGGSPSNRNQVHSDGQVRGFTTVFAMKKHANSLNLTRFMINDLRASTDLTKGYIGGWVVGSCAASYSQGHTVSIFVRDESSTDHHTQDSKQLTITVDGEIAEFLPSMLSKDYSLFVHNGEVYSNTVEYSQDLDYSVNVSGDQARLWVIHKNANKAGFFEQKACKSGWYKKQKRRAAAAPPVTLQRPPPNDTQDDFSYASTQSFSLPNDFGFSDSAFVDAALNLLTTNNTDHSPAHKHALSEKEGSEHETSMASSSSEGSGDEIVAVDNESPTRKGRKKVIYQYKKLSELEQGDKKVNVFGVVKEFSEPKQSQGTDLYTSMILTDETCSEYGVRCMSFRRTQEELPQIRRVGDIVSLHRVFTDVHQGQLQIINNRFSSCQRFSGLIGRSFKVHTSLKNFTFTSEDKKRVKELRRWYQREFVAKELANIEPGCPAGLICQVTAVTQPIEKDCVLLKVWDGTTCRLSLQQREPLDDDLIVSKCYPALSAVACEFEHQVIITDKDLLQRAITLEPGDIVTINNVLVVPCGDKYELCVKSERVFDDYGSSIEVLNVTDFAHSELTATLVAATNKQAIVTTTPHMQRPLITVAGIKEWSTLPVKAHLRVKVLNVVTPSLEDTVKLKCDVCSTYSKISRKIPVNKDGTTKILCPVCKVDKGKKSKGPKVRAVYTCAIEVTDLSGVVMQIYIIEEECTKLLNVQPTNFYQHQDSRYELLEKLSILTGGNTPFQSETTQPRPWVECSVLKVKYEGSTFYFIFDTTLVSQST